MATPPTDYLLIKLDKIEDMIRDLKQLIVEKSPSPAVQTLSATPSLRPRLDWLLSMKSVMWLGGFIRRHLPMLATLVYLKATGQSDKILAYLNSFVGL